MEPEEPITSIGETLHIKKFSDSYFINHKINKLLDSADKNSKVIFQQLKKKVKEAAKKRGCKIRFKYFEFDPKNLPTFSGKIGKILNKYALDDVIKYIAPHWNKTDEGEQAIKSLASIMLIRKNKIIKVRRAICHPLDKSDKTLGYILALWRMARTLNA